MLILILWSSDQGYSRAWYPFLVLLNQDLPAKWDFFAVLFTIYLKLSALHWRQWGKKGKSRWGKNVWGQSNLTAGPRILKAVAAAAAWEVKRRREWKIERWQQLQLRDSLLGDFLTFAKRGGWLSSAASCFPEEHIHNFRASRSGDRRMLCSSETSCDWFWSSKIVKRFVGLTAAASRSYCCFITAGMMLSRNKQKKGGRARRWEFKASFSFFWRAKSYLKSAILSIFLYRHFNV